MITSGLVSFEDGRKGHEQFDPARKVRVELSFSVPEGADYTLVLAKAAMSAKTAVKDLIFGTTAVVAAGTPTTELSAIDVHHRAAREVDQSEKKGRGRPKKVEPLPAVEPFLGTGEVAATPATPGTAPTSQAKVTENVSDAALYDAVVTINAKLNMPKQITAIIKKHCPDDGIPPSLKRIPAGSRIGFLAELRAWAAEVNAEKKDEIEIK